MKATPMPAGMDGLTLELVGLVREYERNCRCPRCHEQALQCTECGFCQSNLQKLFLRELTNPKAAAAFFACQANADHSTIAFMQTKKPRKTKARKSAPKPKAKAKSKSKAKLKLKTKRTPSVHTAVHTKPAEPTPEPQAIAEPRAKKPAAGVDDPYAKRIFVRFESAELKELVRKAAEAVPMSMSAYIAATAVKLAREGWKPEMKPQAVERAAAAKAS
jgi:hypothetical protein